MLKERGTLFRLPIYQPTVGTIVDKPISPEADLFSLSQCIVSIMLCNKLPEFSGLK